MGDKTGILCRKLLFIFYFTKPKVERMLCGALQWRECFPALAQARLLIMRALYCKCGTNGAEISN